MKVTIFLRILLATLLPLVFVFTLVIVTINNIIYVNWAASARQGMIWEAEKLVRLLSHQFQLIDGTLHVVSRSMGEMDFTTHDAAWKAENMTRKLLFTLPALYSSWYAFEPGVFHNTDHVYQTFINDGGEIKEIRDIAPETFQHPERAPWYFEVFATGGSYTGLASAYDYGTGEGPHVIADMTVPIYKGGP